MLLALLAINALAADWVMIDKKPHLTIEGWAALTDTKSYYEPKSGKLLFEGKGKAPVIFLLNSPYALQGEKFLSLPQGPFAQGNKILLAADSAQRVFDIKDKIPEKGQACHREHPIKKIFLDPGHGGSDVGTKKQGVNEKDIVLKFSRLVADELRRRGFEVAFSRTKDVYLPLDIRTKLAKEWKADLFISLHVNSSPSPEAHGTETYILNQDATDAEARRLALLENSIAYESSVKQSAVVDILWDMEQTAYLQDSAYLASSIQGAIVSNAHDLLRKQKAGDWKNRGVRQAPFFVLNRATMPAVLVELGYLSNVRDRKLLTEKIFQESLAKALAEGVSEFKENCKSF